MRHGSTRHFFHSASRGLTLAGLLGSASAGWAAFGETRTVAAGTPIPANWVILAQASSDPILGPNEEGGITIMDTTGAPYGTRLMVLFQSPIPDGWTIVGPRRGAFTRGDHRLCIENANDPPPEGMPGSPSQTEIPMA